MLLVFFPKESISYSIWHHLDSFPSSVSLIGYRTKRSSHRKSSSPFPAEGSDIHPVHGIAACLGSLVQSAKQKTVSISTAIPMQRPWSSSLTCFSWPISQHSLLPIKSIMSMVSRAVQCWLKSHADHNSALCAYIEFLGVIWFTWLQVTLFDVRFARDSVFERGCKAIQLGAMVGFASAGSRFSTTVRGENAWAFQSLTLILAGSRALLAVQYTVNVAFLRSSMKHAAKGVAYTALVFWATTLFYVVVCTSVLPL